MSIGHSRSAGVSVVFRISVETIARHVTRPRSVIVIYFPWYCERPIQPSCGSSVWSPNFNEETKLGLLGISCGWWALNIFERFWLNQLSIDLKLHGLTYVEPKLLFIKTRKWFDHLCRQTNDQIRPDRLVFDFYQDELKSFGKSRNNVWVQPLITHIIKYIRPCNMMHNKFSYNFWYQLRVKHR